MATDIVPIQLALTAGDRVTLWAPTWREHGEEWQAFLGDDDALFVFPDAAHLAAFVRTVASHDLSDHPAWSVVPRLAADELVPEANQRFDLIGVPELVAEKPDTWTLGELAEITAVLRALGEVCGLDVVADVLGSAEGFGLLEHGSWAFSGRDGAKRWAQLGDVVARRWDELIDAVDGATRVPEIDTEALATARAELLGAAEDTDDDADADADAGSAEVRARRRDEAEATDAEEVASAEDTDEPVGFWEQVGIDPILIGTPEGDHYTLRCYLDDAPVFLGSGGQISVFRSARALARHLAGAGAEGHDLTRVSTWPEVLTKATAGELDITVDEQNSYQLTGIGEDLTHGPTAVDPHQLDLAVELLLDVAEWSGDDAPGLALSRSQSLGWLISFVLDPSPNRMAPSPPFEPDAGRWNSLVDDVAKRLHRP